MFPFDPNINPIHELTIDVDDFPVVIHPTKLRDCIKIPLGISLSFNHDQLCIKQTQSNDEVQRNRLNHNAMHVINLYLSEETLTHLSIKTKVGNVTFQDVVIPQTKVTIITETGVITLRDSSFDEVRMKGHYLKLNVRDMEVQNKTLCSFTNGNLTLKRLSSHTFKSIGKKGKVIIEGQSQIHEIENELNEGTFFLKQVRSDRIKLKIKEQGYIELFDTLFEVLRARTSEGCIRMLSPSRIYCENMELDSDRPLTGFFPEYKKNNKQCVLCNQKGPIVFQ